MSVRFCACIAGLLIGANAFAEEFQLEVRFVEWKDDSSGLDRRVPADAKVVGSLTAPLKLEERCSAKSQIGDQHIYVRADVRPGPENDFAVTLQCLRFFYHPRKNEQIDLKKLEEEGLVERINSTFILTLDEAAVFNEKVIQTSAGPMNAATLVGISKKPTDKKPDPQK